MKFHFSGLLAGAAFALAALPAGADEQDVVGRFDISGFAVQGNTLLPPHAVDSLLAPYAGAQRSFGDVQRALEALEAAYRKRGFNVVQVVLPEQELNQGVVTLQVVETRIGKVSVRGNSAFDDANIRRSLPGLVEGQAPNIGDISAGLKLANENPAKKTALQLQGGARDDEIDAILKVDDERPWKIGASVDNSGNDSTGKTRLTTQFQHANVAGRDHLASLQYTTTVEKPSQVNVYGLGYRIPLYGIGDSVDLFASYSDVDSSAVVSGVFDFQVSGRGAVYGARYNRNLRRAGAYESRLVYGIDYKDYRNNVSFQGAQLGSDVTVHPLSVAYAGAWTLAAGEASFALTALHNLPGGERGGSAAFNRVRAGADPSYDILRYSAAYARLLPRDWQARVAVAGQFSPDALVPGEQFGAGGAGTVRGFQERELAGDAGHLLSIEAYTPNVCARIGGVGMQCRALAFYDVARVRRNDPLPGEAARSAIGSVGIGWRMTVGRHLALNMDFARVVDAGPIEGKGDQRLHVKLGATY